MIRRCTQLFQSATGNTYRNSSVGAEVWSAIKPAAGYITLALAGFITGGLIFSKNVTIKKGDFVYSSDIYEHSLAQMNKEYALRVKHLRDNAHEAHAKYVLQSTTEAAKDEIAKNIVSYYLVPTSHDKLFGRDVVFFNGKGKPTILLREDFDDISDQWKRVLVLAKLKDCVDTFKIGNDYPACDASTVANALKRCVNNQKCN